MDEISPLLDKKEVLSQCEKIFYFTLGTLALAGGIGSTTIASLNLLTDFTNFPLHAYAIFFGLVITVLEVLKQQIAAIFILEMLSNSLRNYAPAFRNL